MRRALLVSVALLGPMPARADPAASAFASPMVDLSLYRDGAVHRLSGRFGTWTVTCDEIARLGRRFCSLKAAAARDGDGRTVTVDVSTGDDGRPAALLHLPLAVSIPFGVRVAFPGPGPALQPRGTKAGRATERTIPIASCDGRECLAVWSLGPADLGSLDAGAGLTFTYCTAVPGALEFATDLNRRGCGVRRAATLSGLGFRDAVQASMKGPRTTP